MCTRKITFNAVIAALLFAVILAAFVATARVITNHYSLMQIFEFIYYFPK